MTVLKRIGLIAGGGELPKNVHRGAMAQGIDVFTIVLNDFASPDDFPTNSEAFRLGDFGKLLKTLEHQKVDAVCFAGNVARPDFKTFRPDLGGMKYLPGVIAAAAKGDDALLRHVSGIFESKGMPLVGPQQFCSALLAPEGVWGKVVPVAPHLADIDIARDIAREIGRLDIGQGAIVARGLVLAVEAAEGTDAMLSRITALPQALRGTITSRSGVLAKIIKPGQDDRMDLPTVGVSTVEAAAVAGLAGIAVEAGRAFVINKDRVIASANRHGLFVIGLPPNG
ncbi:LpxI family protein [Robiginitomaculum antarcticum]|uniref:LpxI family protein n=1 Tax=Robiginitomaculum antarcticum TaxID=437507 RepID=UPI00036B2605